MINDKSIKNLKTFEPGKSGNPNGRPKGAFSAKTVIARILKSKEKIIHPLTKKQTLMTQLEIIALAQLKKARSGDVKSFDALLDRFEGKPEQKQSMKFDEDTNADITVNIKKSS